MRQCSPPHSSATDTPTPLIAPGRLTHRQRHPLVSYPLQQPGIPAAVLEPLHRPCRHGYVQILLPHVNPRHHFLRFADHLFHSPFLHCHDIMELSSTLVNPGPCNPSYLFGATTWREGCLTPARCRKRNDTFSPNDARRAPLAHLTKWPICKVNTTYK